MPSNPHSRNFTTPQWIDAKRDPQQLLFWVIAACVFLIEFLLTAHMQVFNLRGPDSYSALHWTRDYSHGFARRALLGQTLHWLHLDNTNYLLILVISWAISLLLFLLIVQSVHRLTQGLCQHERTAFAIALLLCPLTAGIVIGCTGDPLELILVFYLLLLRYVIEPARQPILTAATFVLFGIAASLIHEASLFFIAPALAVAAFILFRTATARAALVGYILGAVPVIAAIVLTNNQVVSHDYVAQLHYGSRIFQEPGSQGFESFSTLFHEENVDRFGRGLRGYLAMGLNTIGTTLLPAFFALQIITFLFPRESTSSDTRKRVLLAFLLPIPLAAPLFVIAHDWGRFLAYAFILTLAALAAWRPTRSIPPSERRLPILGLDLLLAGLTTTSLIHGYGVRGLESNHRILLCSLPILAAATYLLHRLNAQAHHKTIP